MAGDPFDDLVVRSCTGPNGAPSHWEARLPFDGSWVAVVELRLVEGVLVATSLSIVLDSPWAIEYPAGGLTARSIRSVNLGALTEAAKARIVDPGPRASLERLLGAVEVAQSKDPARGRPGHPPARLREVALLRLEATRVGARSYRPYVAAAMKDRGHPIGADDLDLARDWVKAARDAGWLAPAGGPGTRDAQPGRLLVEEWAREGAPEWWTDT